MNKLIAVTAVGFFWSSMVLMAADAEKAREGMTLGQPFWRSKVMENEPILFIQEEGKPVASGKLLFTPSAKPKITHPDLVMEYKEGKDYIWKPGSDTIELTATSRIPFKTSAQMVPPPGSPNMFATVLHSEGHFFHDLQVQVTYEHADAWTWQDAPQPERLTRVLAKLRGKQPIKFVALGDSITAGFNASGYKPSLAPPYQPAYPQLVANTLQKRFGATVTLVNLSVSGSEPGWGLKMVPKVTEQKPDLVLLAFGMNDSGSFEERMRKLRDAVQADNPDADIVLVASMSGNPRFFGAEGFVNKSKALGQLVTTNVAMADVTAPWQELLKRKPFSDLSGNNVNHPNDFGHRLYAQIVLQLFPLTSESARDKK